ncbi:PREDICTED: pantothenate kinase 4 [Thamnophis sirtalis]|uniref:4'-phosphopantetheine phosphatase n=1 Tax=Thamnophis sirtalis TaxID=35019 RepID=A0A6I9YDC3_9SAUR|nr:PREDICTED: pantothenate kinase 4 [Thamnophis sirtalis]
MAFSVQGKHADVALGGSLAKLAYYSTVQHKVARVQSFDQSCKDVEHESPYEITVQEEITARLHFIKFENTYIEACLDFIKDHLVNTETKVIKATGGGAYKFKELIEEKLGLKLDKEDVMTCLIKGCNFVLKNIPHEAFVYLKDADPEFRFQMNHPHIFPYLLVNIGSGVSIVKVRTETLPFLTSAVEKFDELLQLASKGQHTNVDMLVKDIYGGAYQTLGLSGNLIASSFGKSATVDKDFSKEDMAKSLLHMISNDIGQLACLHAKLHNLDKIYFGGFFIRGHPVTMRTITYSINFFSKVAGIIKSEILEQGHWGLRGPNVRNALILSPGSLMGLFFLSQAPAHKCALIFADNSGIDVILGVFPFVRELLCRGTEVILACNSGPALNDVTYNESLLVAERIATMDTDIDSALKEERLLLVQTGSSSPCLDLSRLDKGLASLVRERKTDLVIIEGMGRAIHTNYHAKLKCESLKLAVLKNSWLADRLGGKIFSVIFKYEVPLKSS